MTTGVSGSRARSLALAAGGFALLSVGDGMVKSIDGAWPGTAVAALRYAFGAFGLALWLWRTEGRPGFSMPLPWIQLGRALAVSVSAASFFLAVFLMPLAEAATIQFTNPLIVALVSALFLKHRTPGIVWISIIFGFLGVLIVLRPNIAAIGPIAILPLVAAVGMAAMLFLNRKVAGSGGMVQMQFLVAVLSVPILTGFAILGHFSGWPPLHIGPLSWTVAAKCAFVAVSATLAHTMIYAATVKSRVNDVAPTVYVQLVVAMLIGYGFFGEHFDAIAMAGAALIILGGLILWHNQRNRPDQGVQ